MEAGAIIQRAQRLAGRVDPDFDDRSYQYLNEAMEEWATEFPWSTLHGTLELPADGSQYLYVPNHVLSVRSVMDLTHFSPVEARGSWDREAPVEFVQGSAGPAVWWIEDGLAAAIRQPSGPLSVVCSATDSSTACVSGLIQNTAYSGTALEFTQFTETISFAAATGATLSTVFYDIQEFGKTERTTGEVRLCDSTGVISAITPAQFSAQFRRLKFLYRPPAGTVMRLQVINRPAPVYLPNHVPHSAIDPNYLIWFIAGLIHKSTGQDQRAGICIARANEILRKRIKVENTHGDRDWTAAPDAAYWTHERMNRWEY